ncbi:MAG TPA: hypothetical protein VGN82_11480 [Bosea sp. (in: a-proteobacteria)]|uniref:hypothetical protein n=1 Tax=Bosea sp. (in: a-proteobacteria) TaxID=1871050 RepID=UPI002E0DDAFA|nr:hypothetical protein [Bosea sp. (in: a-proteobacteria)]
MARRPDIRARFRQRLSVTAVPETSRVGSVVMERAYKIAPITTEQVDAGYLLVSPLDRRLDVARWRSYCEKATSELGTAVGRQQIVVATNPRGYLQGLCVHAVVKHLVQGAILDVPVFVVASAADEIGVAAALFGDLCALAERLDCAAIRIRTESSQRLHRHLESSGRSACERRVALILDQRPLLEAPWAQSQGDGLPVKT